MDDKEECLKQLRYVTENIERLQKYIENHIEGLDSKNLRMFQNHMSGLMKRQAELISVSADLKMRLGILREEPKQFEQKVTMQDKLKELAKDVKKDDEKEKERKIVEKALGKKENE